MEYAIYDGQQEAVLLHRLEVHLNDRTCLLMCFSRLASQHNLSIKHNFLGDGFVLYTRDFHALLEDLSFLTTQDFLIFKKIIFLWLSFVGGTKKMKEQEFITHTWTASCAFFSI